jgi:uncharacterized protein (DUF58 family)
MYSLFFTALLIFAVFTNDRAAYLALYALAALFLMALACIILAPYLIRVEEEVGKQRLFKNEELIYTARVSGKYFFLYPSVTFTMYSDEIVSYDRDSSASPAADGLSGDYILRFPYRGPYMVGVKSITVTDFLGLFKRSFPARKSSRVLVYPEKDDDFVLDQMAELLDKSASSFDVYDHIDADVADVRKYDPSDDYRKIHWKLTAKRGELIVKNYQSAMLTRTALYLDPRATTLRGAAKSALEDKLASLVASSLNYLVMSRQPSELIYGGGPERREHIRTQQDLDMSFGLLAELEFNESGSFTSAFSDALNGDSGFMNMFVYLSEMDGELYATLRDLAAFGHSVTVYYVHMSASPPGGETERLFSELRASGAIVYGVAV